MIPRTLIPTEIEKVIAQYNIGTLSSLAEPGGGTANANAIIETAEGKYLLKRRNPKYADLGYVAFDHSLMEHLVPYSLGTPLATKTRAGERWLILEGRVYELYPYLKGNEHDRFSLEQLASVGRHLALFHTATRSFPLTEGKEWERYQDPAKIREGLTPLVPHLKARLSSVDFDYLFGQVSLLEREFPDTRYYSLPKRVVHGDYHPGNLKFLGERVSGLFDFDWATLQPRLLDIADGVFLFAGERATAIDAGDIVSLTQTWMPSRERTRLFLEAYLEEEEITEEEWQALGLALRARWLYCRIAGMEKLPEVQRLHFLLNGLLEPLRALSILESLFLHPHI